MPIKPDVALVVDALPGLGGAEKVLLAAMELFPHAPIYTLVYNRQAFIRTPIANRQVISSYMARLPLARTQYRKYLPLMPHAIERFDLSRYQQVISFSYAVAHGVLTQPGQSHISYTYTPMRYAWRGFGLNGEQHEPNKMSSFLFRAFRGRDLTAITHVQRLAAVSQWIARWVNGTYQRQATVIYPPVEVERFSPQSERERYYVTVGRLVAHKRLDLIIGAFNRLNFPLLVIGDGPERHWLERHAGANTRFLGFRSDGDIAAILGRARGYLCAGEEDFGIAIVEAQAAGCPVVAYRKGGALEIVVEGETGLFFDESTSDHLAEAVLRCENQMAKFDARQITARAQRFNKRRFLQEFAAFARG